MNTKRFTAVVAVLLLSWICGRAANKDGIITGRILSQDNKPLDFATVYIENSTLAAYSSEDGAFILRDIPDGQHTLIASYVGYTPRNLPVTIAKGQTVQLPDILLEPDGELEEIVVIGKSETRKIQELSYSVAALDVSRYRNVSSDLNQLVNKTSGVRIREEGGMGSGYSFNLNGFSGKQVKFFLDGIPMDNFATAFGLQNLSPGMVGRVEVYKGVLPIHLAADALGGAVNIVSRRESNYVDASYALGSFNTHRLAVNHAYTAQSGFTVRTHLFYNYSNNNYKVWVPVMHLQTKETGPYRWVKRFHDDYQAAGLKIESGWIGRKWADHLLFGLILSGNNKEIQNGVTMEKVYGGKTADSRSFVPSLKYQKKNLFIKGLDVNLYGNYSHSAYHFTDTTAFRYNWLGERIPQVSSSSGEDTRSRLRLRDEEWQLLSNVNYRVNDHHAVALNYSFTRFGRKTDDKEDPENKTHQIPQHFQKQITGIGWNIDYTRWNATFFSKLYTLRGKSYEYVDQFLETERIEAFDTRYDKLGYGTATSWFLADPLQVKFSYEHTYRLPDGHEMFGDGLFNQRNPELKPESSDNLNLGLLFNRYVRKTHHMSAEVGFIFRKSKDFIQKELRDPSTRYINLGKVKTIGIEAGARYEYASLFHLSAVMTWQRMTDDMKFISTTGYVGAGEKKNFTYKDRIPNIPYLFGNVDAGIRKKGWLGKKTEVTADYNLAYVHAYYLAWESLGSQGSKNIIPEQISHNVALGCSWEDGRYNLAFECKNLTDALLYDNYLLQKPGRAFTLKFRYYISY